MLPLPVIDESFWQFRLPVTTLLNTCVGAVLFWSSRLPLTVLPATLVLAQLFWTCKFPLTELWQLDAF